MAIVLATGQAHGQIEARCPSGWDIAPIVAVGEGQRPIVACVRAPMQIAALQFERTIPPGDPLEQTLAVQLTLALGLPPPPTPPTFRTETIAGKQVRWTEISATGQTEDGRTVHLSATVAIIPVGNTTVVVRGFTQDASRANVSASVRAFIPTMVGLDGSIPPWRASASCPSGLFPLPDPGVPSNGARRVVLCASEQSGRRIDVLESRLPVRNAMDARIVAQHHRVLIERQLIQLGGSVTMEEPRTVTFGTVRGFAIALHGSASDPRVPPGTQGATIRIETLVVVIPTSVGHVQVVAISDQDPDALARQVQGFVTEHLRLDGAGAPSATADQDAGQTDASTSPTRRRREIDLSLPLWEPPPEERPRATSPPPKSSSKCGCTTPGAVSEVPMKTLLSLGLSLLTRRWHRRTRQH